MPFKCIRFLGKVQVVSCAVVAAVLLPIISGGSFCYSRPYCGPTSHHWGGQCKVGHLQSPVDIPLVYNRDGLADYRSLIAKGYGSQKLFLQNNGHTVKLGVSDNTSVPGYLSGSLLHGSRFIFQELHFHWGSDDKRGSEHTLGGVRYPLEAHFVHYNSDYPDFVTALESNDSSALAVIGLLFKLTPFDNPTLAPIIRGLSGVRKADTTIDLAAFDLLGVLPLSLRSSSYTGVVQYSGSLTTPICNEVVMWNVLYTAAFISSKQLQEFRHLRTRQGSYMVDNYRPLQAENFRPFSILAVTVEES